MNKELIFLRAFALTVALGAIIAVTSALRD
jgi:hypothetical protein